VIIRYLFWFVIATVSFSQAGLATTSLDRDQQRKLFIKAQRLAHNPNSSAFKILMEQLEGYPLKPVQRIS
jgi:soluble lytic murein transglycosylase